MTFLAAGLADKSADGVICVRCGYVHTFMGDAHEWVDPAVVDPADLPRDPVVDRGEAP